MKYISKNMFSNYYILKNGLVFNVQNFISSLFYLGHSQKKVKRKNFKVLNFFGILVACVGGCRELSKAEIRFN